ncbi:DmpA family aminopeptidase [Limobrevibacterium gyesilva]|uniref:P1 family peptidase n=1 Tax=Limobrevibacterium gyesilva TaxID=2991712 RepID=A0AA41YL33_9PROT|nr:P1 family peptidase [Limobrevibacterium gyesilva]MCW3474217.1 P1 family peptidase [Limobrevibacterium gyesilva]
MARARLRDLGIVTGQLPPGPWNAITDVAGVRVGFATLVRDTPAPVRTGVTAIWPRGPEIWTDWVFAGSHSFNGNGEMTGLAWVAEQGLISAPICITNTYSVGLVRDAICALAVRDDAPQPWHLPVAAETYDGWLSDSASFPVTTELALQAMDAAATGPVAEGNVGGGTGMICHEFKGGTGTASRVVQVDGAAYTVGALVQANYGARALLRVDGVPVGREIGADVVPSHRDMPTDAGSIIVVLATDAPLLPIQCQRLARRATTGLAWVGGIGANSSGDIFLAFSTANRPSANDRISSVRMLAPDGMTGLFQAAAEATEEAILNAMTAAETTVGLHGRTAHALPLDRLQEVMRRYRPRG